MIATDPHALTEPAAWSTATFLAYGTRYGFRSLDPALLAAATAAVPRGWLPTVEDTAAHWYTLAVRDRTITLSLAAEVLAVGEDLGRILADLTRHAELLGATHATDYLFVHAGVVGWQGQAILIPGRSYSGKTTLVKALVDAGASYYSDEFALLDRRGWVHPYARPLAIRQADGQPTQHVPADALGGTTGTAPIPIGLIVITTYQPGARWRPRPLTPGQALLALMDNTVAAQGDPAHSMPILRQAVTSGVILAGPRGTATDLVPDLLARLSGR